MTAIEGISVGHAHDEAARTGCTVVLVPPGTTAAKDVCGGAIIAGPRGADGAFTGNGALHSGAFDAALGAANTTALDIVATNATLNKAGCERLAHLERAHATANRRCVDTWVDTNAHTNNHDLHAVGAVRQG